MAKILIVDDKGVNRQVLMEILKYQHEILEAIDGQEALTLARAEHPDLLITDVLMPSMDGYELVRQLRADPLVAYCPVIFYTGHYLEREARTLAEALGVTHFLYKPCEPEQVLHTVAAALGCEPAAGAPRTANELVSGHQRLLTNKLAQQVQMLENVNDRLHALVDLGLQLAGERDLSHILEIVCEAARKLVDARGAVIVIMDESRQGFRHFVVRGLEEEELNNDRSLALLQKLFSLLPQEPHPCSLHDGADGQWNDLLAQPIQIHALVGGPVVSPTCHYGWLLLLDKLGQPVFSSEDERLVGMIAAQAGCVYENRILYGEVERRAAELEREIAERKRAEEAIQLSEAHLYRVLDTLHSFVGVLTPEGVIAYVNRQVYEVSGLRPQDVLGTPFPDAWWWSHSDAVSGRIGEAIQRARAGEEVRFDTTARVAEERLIDIDFTITPMHDEQGRVTHLIISAVDITERKRGEQIVQAANERLAEADRRKDEFLAMLAHELRNPLAPVRNAVQVMRLIGAREPALDHHRDIIDRQVTHMARLLDDLLDVSRITRGKIQLQKERVDLRAVVTEAVETARPATQTHCHQLSLATPSEPVWVYGDTTRLVQVTTNLLNNAIKYTDAGGQITVSVACDKLGENGTPQAVVKVRDTGMGIAPAMLPRVFDLFAQAEQTLDRSQGGLGIGLCLVSRLVEMHGGSVEAASDGPGQGSQFCYRLPLLDCDKIFTPQSAASTRTPARGAVCRTLIIEDNPDAAESLQDLVSLWGHPVRVALDGHAALAIASEFLPQVALLDIGLPGMNGYEVAQFMRCDERLKSTFLVALTGYGQEEDRQRAESAGFDHYLTKPVDLGELQALLGAVVRDPENNTSASSADTTPSHQRAQFRFDE